jgi:hypothetical protein
MLLGATLTLHAYDFITARPIRWRPGDIPMDLQLDATMQPRVLLDGKPSWNAVAEEALAIWNAQLSQVQFTTFAGATRRDGNDENEVFFSSHVYGHRFGDSVLAITTVWRIGSERVEGDTIFNDTLDWDSYRGPLDFTLDLLRVAIHEFGHTLGLDHPDEAGQVMVAVMNSTITDLDTLAEDDIHGGRALYPPNASYTLNVEINPPGSGIVTATPAPDVNGKYPAGSLVTFTEHPLRRNTFRFWSGDEISAGRRLQLRVVDDETIIANFSTNGAPRILSQPRSQFASFADSILLRVRASSASPPTYQWQFNGTDLPGETTPELFLNFLTHADSGLYACRVTNARGSTFSKPARLVVDGY